MNTKSHFCSHCDSIDSNPLLKMSSKIIMLILFVVISTHDAFSQIAYKHGSLYQSNEKLTKVQVQQMLSAEQFKDYVSGKRLYNTGVVLTSIGGTVAGVSTGFLITSAVANHKNQQTHETIPVGNIISTGGLILGGAILAVGIPCLCVGAGRLKTTASNGIGVTYSF